DSHRRSKPPANPAPLLLSDFKRQIQRIWVRARIADPPASKHAGKERRAKASGNVSRWAPRIRGPSTDVSVRLPVRTGGAPGFPGGKNREKHWENESPRRTCILRLPTSWPPHKIRSLQDLFQCHEWT